MNKLNYYVVLLIAAFVFQVTAVSAQQFGVRGRVLDVENYQPLAGVSIRIANTQQATSTNERGEFSLSLPEKADTFILVSTFVGYKSDSTSVSLNGKDWEFVPVALVNEGSTLEEVVVVRRRERVSEIALLEERKASSLMLEKIGAQELSRKGVGDAAAAVSQLSGVSKQEGSTQVYVRGLGDRYISTSLNGLPIPSSNPNLKNIALDIFTTDVVDFVGVDKSHHSSLSGDFGGATVNIGSKDYTGSRLFEVSVGSTINTNAIKQWDNFYLQQGPNLFGYSDYKAPADAQGSYHFKNSWDLEKKTVTPFNFGVKAGDSFKVGDEGRLSLFAVFNFANGYGARDGVNSNFSAQGAPLKDLRQSQHSYTANTTGMLNTNYQINAKHKLTYNFMYVNAGNQYSDVFTGFIRDAGSDAENYRGTINRSTFSSTQLLINQLLGKHTLTDKVDLNWGFAYNHVKGDMPDRLQSMYRQDANGDHYLIRINAADNHRYTYYLKENEIAANVSGSYKLDGDKGKVTFGYNGKMKERSFDVMQLNFNIKNGQQETTKISPSNLDEYLGASGYGNFYDLIGFAGNAFQYYNGDQDIHAAFANIEYKLTDRLTGVLGLRYENIKQYVDFYSIEYRKGENTLKKNGFLPSLNLKYELNERNNLRLGASKTYTLPQFKERVRFPYEEVTQVIVGNQYLYASDNYNLDLKWEMFPREGELYSITAFGKYIQNPINEIMVSSASNDISYANTGDKGYVYGVELEAKKYLLNLNNNKLSVGFNTAIMKTEQKFNPDKVSRETDGLLNIDPTNPSSKFTGASDFIVNADLSYVRNFDGGKNISATVMYNYYSDKLNAIGTGGLGNWVDKGMGTLDFVLKSKLTKHIGVDLAARNILNPTFERWQENADPIRVLSYKRGAFFSLGVNYRF
ncbi:TonB-dependent receptor [Sphingobacterium wenxiniae]|uniref:Outer membrane receptor proteins, mostly Fe transport n=1 Tax=Sphingobacterium wenxiniae TaxID=683125 RepID=A0A1I6VDG0_9SPHI|nr:TonB-dependent receptor [Sphingobacterium wenxiniae]SFT11766.1 Outer membrane receptor proteins, mostly Fe transport [Sphingobacterium wenxiniae]